MRLKSLLPGWLLLAAFFALRPLDDLDLFTQLRIGVLSFDSPYAIDRLSYLLEGHPVQNPGLLSQLVFAACTAAGGLSGLKLLHVLALSAGIVICLSLSLQGSADAADKGLRAAFVGSAAAAAVALGSQSSARAQSFAVLFFALSLRLMRKEPSLVRVILLACVLWLWQGFHPSALLILVPLLSALADNLRQWPYLLSVSSVMLPPYGVSSLVLARQNSLISRNILRISEWLPPWDPTVIVAMLGPALLAAALPILLYLSPARLRERDRLSLLILAALSLYSARFTVFFALYAVTVLPRLLAGLQPLAPLGAISLHPVVAGAALAASMWLSPLLGADLPVSEVRSLAARVPEGRIYNYREWAGPLHWFGSRDWRTGMDGRLYLFQSEQWRRYEREALGMVRLEELVATHRPSAFFLHARYHSALIAELRASSSWVPFLEIGEVSIFVPAVLSVSSQARAANR